jgi:hypothetical protein
MADITPSPSFNDPDWVPGFENLTPDERLRILENSIWIENSLRQYIASATPFAELILREDTFGDEFEWKLKIRSLDGNVRLVYSYRLNSQQWKSVSASPVVFIRSVISGQWEDFQRFDMDAGFDEHYLVSDVTRQEILNVFVRLFLPVRF